MSVYFGIPDKVMLNSKNSNRVRTQRYTVLTWAPLSLIFQFKRAANIYFMIISLLTCMYFSPKAPQSMLLTFAMVLFFTMMKEAYEVRSFSQSIRIFNDIKQIKRSTIKHARYSKLELGISLKQSGRSSNKAKLSRSKRTKRCLQT